MQFRQQLLRFQQKQRFHTSNLTAKSQRGGDFFWPNLLQFLPLFLYGSNNLSKDSVLGKLPNTKTCIYFAQIHTITMHIKLQRTTL
jgi:hypothetical protein